MVRNYGDSRSTNKPVAGIVQREGELDLAPATSVPAISLRSTRDRDVALDRMARDHHLVLFCYPGDREGLRFPELTGWRALPGADHAGIPQGSWTD